MVRNRQRLKILLWLAIAFVGLAIVGDVAVYLLSEGLWFQEVGYLKPFLLRIGVRGIIWLVAVGVTATFVIGNLWLAAQLQTGSNHSTASRNQPRGALRLRPLLATTIGLSLLLGLLLLYYGQAAIQHWQPALNLNISIPTTFTRLSLVSFLTLLKRVIQSPWQMGGLLGFSALLIIQARWMIPVITLILSLGFGLILSAYWAIFLLSQYRQPFRLFEPLFNQDIGFYIFSLPAQSMLQFWLFGVLAVTLLLVLLSYLLANNSLGQGKFSGFDHPQRSHIALLAGGFFLMVAWRYWLTRYELLYSTRGVIYGAGFTDVNVQLPVNTALALLAIGLAIVLAGVTLFRNWHDSSQQPAYSSSSDPLTAQNQRPQGNHPASSNCLQKSRSLAKTIAGILTPIMRWVPGFQGLSYQLRRLSGLLPDLLRFLTLAGLSYLVVAVLAGFALPAAVQRFSVEPNELAREDPYLSRNIQFTRRGFALDGIEVKTFDPTRQLGFKDLRNNDATIRNIRLWDSRPLLETNRQLQQIRLYYEFPDADIDRYTIRIARAEQALEGSRSRKQQVLIAARELNYEAVPSEAKTWVNEHLVYTHGYGFTLSPVNTAGPGGLPAYFVKDIGTEAGVTGGLEIANDEIRASIPIGHPRIYFGEITNTYIMTSTRVRELDYPSGSENVYNVYDGAAGVLLNPIWKRLAFAGYLRDWQMLLTQNFTDKTRLLFRRNIRDRVQAIAPFLTYDQDPYLVAADADLLQTGRNGLNPAHASPAQTKEGYLYWIMDAYTTSDRFPYSDPGSIPFNYIRNSVKVVVDAYNGSVSFYVADPEDPIIQAWQAIFPEMFQPLAAMPATLRSHIRYPADLFNVQSERLLTYHMTNSQVFYNREDQWQVPSEIYGGESRPIAPYYLIMRLPGEFQEEFILLHPFTPTSRNNLIAWLAGRADGQQYGKLILYQFPKQRLVYGPGQIEARINQDPDISQQISLWNRQGSRAVQGNLLIIPIQQSLLYVEPLYLEAEQTSLPTLARVIVASGDRIEMQPTLQEALTRVFRPDTLEQTSEGLEDRLPQEIQQELTPPSANLPAIEASP